NARRPVGLAGGRLRGVRAGEGNRGRILVELRQVDVELTDGTDDDGGEQAGAVGALQVVQRAADAVVVERRGLAGLQAEVVGDAARDPRGDGVQRLPRQQQVRDE